MHSTSTFKGTRTTLQATGTLKWQAPELLPDMLGRGTQTPEPYNTTATDVYAFALVGYEVSNITVLCCNFLLNLAPDVLWQPTI
jgi:serine/threonine protein kinase